MRPAVAAALALGGFGATLALSLVTPLGDELFLSVAILVGLIAVIVLAALARLRVEALPWLGVPTLAALTLWSFSAPGAYVGGAAAAVVGWCIVGGVLLVRLVRHARRPLARDEALAWGGAVLIGVLVLVAARTEAPLALRFALSKDAMDEVARAVLDGERDPATIDRIGMWNVSDVRRVRGGVQFEVDGAG